MVKGNNRYRYVGFIIQPSKKNVQVGRSDLLQEIKHTYQSVVKTKANDLEIRLIRFNGKYGIIKCRHVEKEQVLTLLQSIDKIKSYKVKITTVGTSGTIRALTKKHMPELTKTRRQGRSPKGLSRQKNKEASLEY